MICRELHVLLVLALVASGCESKVTCPEGTTKRRVTYPGGDGVASKGYSQLHEVIMSTGGYRGDMKPPSEAPKDRPIAVEEFCVGSDGTPVGPYIGWWNNGEKAAQSTLMPRKGSGSGPAFVHKDCEIWRRDGSPDEDASAFQRMFGGNFCLPR